jgi:hypothetical protein
MRDGLRKKYSWIIRVKFHQGKIHYRILQAKIGGITGNCKGCKRFMNPGHGLNVDAIKI